jgi:hypothetical protein
MIGPCGARCRMLQTKHLASITPIPRGVLLFRLAVPLLLLLLSAVGTINGNAQTNVVVIRPTETQDELLNPGMGITTFQRFNGQALNSSINTHHSAVMQNATRDRRIQRDTTERCPIVVFCLFCLLTVTAVFAQVVGLLVRSEWNDTIVGIKCRRGVKARANRPPRKGTPKRARKRALWDLDGFAEISASSLE